MHRKAVSLLSAVAMSAVATSAFAGRTGSGVESFQGQGIPLYQGGTGGTSVLPSVLYQNLPTGAETVFTTTSVPRTGGGDEALFSGPGANLTSMKFGFSIATGGPAAFDARIRLFDDIDFSATAAGSVQFTNLVKEFTVSFTGQTSGAFITNDIAIPGGGAAVTANPANLGVPNVTDVYYQVDFFQPGTTTPVANNLVTYIFDGSGTNTGFTFASPIVGGNGTDAQEVYWRDANGNGVINGDEARLFTGLRANMVLEFTGDIVPEPTSLGLLGLSFVGLGRRRRHA